MNADVNQGQRELEEITPTEIFKELQRGVLGFLWLRAALRLKPLHLGLILKSVLGVVYAPKSVPTTLFP